jgi:hypothetical protein
VYTLHHTILLAIVGTIVAWTNGQVNDVDAIKQIWEALIAATIRQGISKV